MPRQSWESEGVDEGLAAALGRAIASRRGELGLKRNDLRDRSGLSYPYIAELENGTKRPSSRTLAALAEALELRPSELLDRAEQLRAASTPPPPAKTWFHEAAESAAAPAPLMMRARAAAAPAPPPPAEEEPPLTESRLREIIREVVREELARADSPPPTRPRRKQR